MLIHQSDNVVHFRPPVLFAIQRAQECWKQNQKHKSRPRLITSPRLQVQDQHCKTKTKTDAGLRPVLSRPYLVSAPKTGPNSQPTVQSLLIVNEIYNHGIFI